MSKNDMRDLEDVAQRVTRLATLFGAGSVDKTYVMTELQQIAGELDDLADCWKKDLEESGGELTGPRWAVSPSPASR